MDKLAKISELGKNFKNRLNQGLDSIKGIKGIGDIGKNILNSTPDFSNQTQPQPQTPDNNFYSENEINEIKTLLNEVIREKFPEEEIIKKIGTYIDKLSLNERNIEKMKENMMLSIFNTIDFSTSNRNFQYKMLKHLLNLPEISTVVNSLEYSNSDDYIHKIKSRLFDNIKEEEEEEEDKQESVTPNKDSFNKGNFNKGDFSSQPSVTETTPPLAPYMKGSGTITQEEKEKIKELFYTKMTRLVDVDIPDDEIINMFVKYVADILKKNTSESSEIYKKITNKMEDFTNNLFNSNEFKDVEFRKYIFIILLENNSDLLQEALRPKETTKIEQNTTKLIGFITNKINHYNDTSGVKGGKRTEKMKRAKNMKRTKKTKKMKRTKTTKTTKRC
jgi:hypothetical protein